MARLRRSWVNITRQSCEVGRRWTYVDLTRHTQVERPDSGPSGILYFLSPPTSSPRRQCNSEWSAMWHAEFVCVLLWAHMRPHKLRLLMELTIEAVQVLTRQGWLQLFSSSEATTANAMSLYMVVQPVHRLHRELYPVSVKLQSESYDVRFMEFNGF